MKFVWCLLQNFTGAFCVGTGKGAKYNTFSTELAQERNIGSWNSFKPASKLSGALWRRGRRRKESLQLRLWNLNSTSNSLVALRRLSCQIPANQREEESNANLSKHWKIRAKGNDVITNVISGNQHFPSTFSIQIFKFQRRSCGLSFLFPPLRQSALQSLLAVYIWL